MNPKVSDDSFLSFICAVNGILSHHDKKLPVYSIGFVYEIYNKNNQYEDCLEYIERLTDGVFFKIDSSCDTGVSRSQSIVLYRKGNRWSVTDDKMNLIDCDEMKGFFSTREKRSLNLLELMVFWLRKRAGLIEFFSLSFCLSLLSLSIPLYMNAVYGRIIPASAENSLWTLSIIMLLSFSFEIVLKKKRIRLVSNMVSSFSLFREPSILNSFMTPISSGKDDWQDLRKKGIDNLIKFRLGLWVLLSSGYIDAIFLLTHIVAIAVIAKWLALVPLAVFFLQIIATFYIDKMSPDDSDFKNDANSGLPTELIDNYKLNGLMDYFPALYSQKVQSSNSAEAIKLAKKNNSSSVFSFLTSLQTVAIVLTAFYLISNHIISSSAMFATIILSGKITQSTSMLLGFLPFHRELSKSIKEINELTEKSNDFKSTVIRDPSKWSLKNVTTLSRYNHDLNVFNSINLEFSPGEKIAIIGPPGCGKTTLSHILCGIYQPEKGEVFLPDGLNQENGKGSSFYFPQRGFVFYRNLHDSIFSSNVTSDSLIKELQTLDFLSWLPEYYPDGIFSTPIKKLSEDKLQMLEMARLHFSDKKYFILDEPSAHVDTGTEQKLSNILRNKLKDDTTMILFTRSKNLLEFADRVVYLNQFNIVFDGKKEDFLKIAS
ncbi:ATP-binding cassette domain-containing protein [Erwinia sp. HDF1-3R]|uniref:ATP-binding cassette domain-containing protein n=1 Tax=Erwinia sp. HDF1-3R TaxID=3141543 RepID=UPI0031F5999F